MTWSDIVQSLTPDPIGLDPQEQAVQAMQQANPGLDSTDAGQDVLDLLQNCSGCSIQMQGPNMDGVDGDGSSGDGSETALITQNGHTRSITIKPNSLPIPQGWFDVPGIPGIYWSNGTDAYCHTPAPKYVGGPVHEFSFNIYQFTSFRRDGNCPGQN